MDELGWIKIHRRNLMLVSITTILFLFFYEHLDSISIFWLVKLDENTPHIKIFSVLFIANLYVLYRYWLAYINSWIWKNINYIQKAISHYKNSKIVENIFYKKEKDYSEEEIEETKLLLKKPLLKTDTWNWRGWWGWGSIKWFSIEKYKNTILTYMSDSYSQTKPFLKQDENYLKDNLGITKSEVLKKWENICVYLNQEKRIKLSKKFPTVLELSPLYFFSKDWFHIRKMNRWKIDPKESPVDNILEVFNEISTIENVDIQTLQNFKNKRSWYQIINANIRQWIKTSYYTDYILPFIIVWISIIWLILLIGFNMDS